MTAENLPKFRPESVEDRIEREITNLHCPGKMRGSVPYCAECRHPLPCASIKVVMWARYPHWDPKGYVAP